MIFQFFRSIESNQQQKKNANEAKKKNDINCSPKIGTAQTIDSSRLGPIPWDLWSVCAVHDLSNPLSSGSIAWYYDNVSRNRNNNPVQSISVPNVHICFVSEPRFRWPSPRFVFMKIDHENGIRKLFHWNFMMWNNVARQKKKKKNQRPTSVYQHILWFGFYDRSIQALCLNNFSLLIIRFMF